MSTPEFQRNLLVQSRYANRGLDTKFEDSSNPATYVGLELIDTAILRYLQNTIKPIVNQQGKQIQVPVIYGNPERWKSAQRDGSIRDKNGMIQLPIMMITRTTMKESVINNPTNKYQTYIFKSGWNSRNIYDRFAQVNNITPSEKYHQIIIPDYYTLSYDGIIWTEYMQQMNLIIENLSFENNEYWGEYNNYKFNVKIGDFQQSTDLPVQESRMVRNKFSMQVKAYIVPKDAIDKNGNRQQTTKLVYSPKKLVFSSELVTSSLK